MINTDGDIYEVKRFRGSNQEFVKWSVFSRQPLDGDSFNYVADGLRSIELILDDEVEEYRYLYNVKFQRTVIASQLRKIFPDCMVFPVCQR